VIKGVIIANQSTWLEWECWLGKRWLLRLKFEVKTAPLLIIIFTFFLILFYCIPLSFFWCHLNSFIKSIRINFFQNSLKSNQTFLKNFVPMIFSKIYNYGHQHRECFLLVCFKNIKEVVILKEAHCTICYLQMNSTNAFNYSFK